MPFVTVRLLLRHAFPAGTRAVAGESGLDRQVTWPATLRRRAPAFGALKGGEIALLSTAALRQVDERLTLPRAIQMLAEAGVAAVAVQGEITAEARELANRAGIPLLELPAEVSLPELEQQLTRHIIDLRTELHDRTQEIHRQLTELNLQGRGLRAIVERLSQLTGQACALEDEEFELRHLVLPAGLGLSAPILEQALAASSKEVAAWAATARLAASNPPTAKLSLPGAREEETEAAAPARSVATATQTCTLSRLVAPVVVRDRIEGYLSLIGPDEALGELERAAVGYGAAACAIEMVKEHAVLEAEDRRQADFLDDLLSGALPSEESALRRARRFGYDLTRPRVALFFRGAPEMRLAEELERELARRQVDAIIAVRSGGVAVLYPLDGTLDAAGLKGVVERIRAAVALACRTPELSVGIGRYRPGITALHESYREAEQAAITGERVYGPGRVTYFGDLGLYRLLLSLQDSPALREFYEETVAALVEYDRRNKTELVRTLEGYFEAHDSPTEAAQLLHVHRNTLLYRLRRIEEITGLSLDDAEVRLALHLALRVGKILGAEPA
jgi:purine catabolism regulator